MIFLHLPLLLPLLLLLLRNLFALLTANATCPPCADVLQGAWCFEFVHSNPWAVNKEQLQRRGAEKASNFCITSVQAAAAASAAAGTSL